MTSTSFETNQEIGPKTEGELIPFPKEQKFEVVIMGDSDCKKDAVRSFLQTSLTHIAEFQITVLEVIACQFGLKMEDLVEAVRSAAEFQKKALTAAVAKTVIELKTKKGKKIIVKQKQKQKQEQEQEQKQKQKLTV